MKCTIKTSSAEETEQFAEKLGKNLRGGEVIELVSDLGGGKTTFVRGLARGYGSTDRVASPTFTLSKVYKSGKKELWHFDFYRLHDAGIVALELQDLLDDPAIVVVIEWATAVHHVLPEERVAIELKRTGETERELRMSYPGKLKYLMGDL